MKYIKNSINYKRILVTGGYGFIGTNLINELIKNKYNSILNIDKDSISSNTFLKNIKYKNLINININLINSNKLQKILDSFKPDIVYNLASETHVDSSITNPIYHFNNNLIGTVNLLTILNSMINKKKLNKNFKFIHMGTDEIYGDLPLNSKKSFNEKQKISPNNPYACSKASAVLAVNTWCKNFNFPAIVANSVNNFGYYQYVEKFIPRSILNAYYNKTLEVYGSGKNIRSWISAIENSKALIFLAKKGKIGETYNIGSRYKFSNIEVAKKILVYLKSKKVEAKISFVKDRVGHDQQYSINYKKISKLGWSSKFSFDDELKKVINWYLTKKNLKYFKKIKRNLRRKGF